ncbi:DnaJ-domain-containing protein [Dothidotthia symphoricarpi CBS 119687]|uniref:DnaJ-domain-containing protein n=1 Tax=Dothidotthia symphoricarpi CBS 119687 TaxID=1392245 RepID=A0A6A6A797_9PLEO|nr:DnaJ-domain-containing protein [Dothidotthia symphoricarpi CBS 119687]KAF2126677.1 DnaJ-domain-containing protein [Dothidotthia symphoricarpi CBS 119687]
MSDTNKDLQDLARTTTEDLYALLAVPFDAEEAHIKRAYRKASIKYHPDKNPDNADAADRFIYLGWARDILLDEGLKGEYDRARARRREKNLQDELLSGTRRRMMEDLEARERAGRDAGAGLKRKRAEDMSEAERQEQEVQRLAEDGKRRRKEAQERRRKLDEESLPTPTSTESAPTPTSTQPGATPALARTIKARFHRSPTTQSWDKHTLSTLFARYGPIDSVVTPKDKKIRDSGAKHRRLVAVAFIVYTRVDHAYAAVADAMADMPALESVGWAHAEPDLKGPGGEAEAERERERPSAPSTPIAKSFRTSFGPGMGGKGLGGTTTPLGTPKFSFSPKTPSLEEVTMMRLKQAEKKRLEEQIRRQEAVEEATTS